MKKLLAFLCVAAMLLAGCQEAPAPAEHTHTLIHNVEKAPTCINNGIKEHWYCPECNGRFTDEAATKEVTFFDLEVEELGHIGGTATCTEAAICDRCSQPHGAALGHTWDDAEATVKNCTVCGIHVNASFAGGKGTAEEPYLVKNAQQLANITNFYDTYKYYKVADGVETIDMTGFGKILLNGSFDGNGVKIVNLNTALFEQVGYQNTAADIKISNLDVTMNVTDGRALVRNIFNSGKTTFENVAVHGYIEGLYNMGSFFNYGTANCDGKGANYTVEFVNATSDVTLVCTSGNVAGGFLGHSFEGTDNSFTMVIDANSAFTGKIMTTNGKGNLYFAMTSDYYNANNHFIINGEEVKFNNGQIPAAANTAKIAIKAPAAVEGESAYAVEAVEGATEFVVYLNVQVTAYDEEGYKIANKNGMTWPLGNFGMDELAEMGLINSLVIVNGTDNAFGYEVADGVLTVYSGRSDSYESGNVYLQINQYNADGELLATGTLTVCTLEHDHTFVGTSCTTNGKCNCGATEKATGHSGAAATCTKAQICDACGIEMAPAKGHADANADYKCDACSTKMLPADGEALTIPQALAVAKVAGSSYTTQKYYITGVIKNVYNTTYGNMYIKDEAGNEICIYGLYTWNKAVRYDKMDYKPVAGDEITVYTVLGAYNTTYQGKDAWLDEVVAHEHDYKAVVTEPTCTKAGFTTHTCTICDGYYTDSETEALGHTTENGTCERCGLTLGGDAPAYETFTADFDTIASANSSYGTYKTKAGWQGTNCAVVQGGSSDSNPTFKVLGATSATKGYVLNGKTSAKGKLVSPTLSGGISKITFNYTNVFSESNGVDITITIKQNGTAVATKKLDNNSVTQLKAYTFEWDLAGEGVAVSGDFTIEITNNSPSNNSSKNKDRVAIWNLEWNNNPA